MLCEAELSDTVAAKSMTWIIAVLAEKVTSAPEPSGPIDFVYCVQLPLFTVIFVVLLTVLSAFSSRKYAVEDPVIFFAQKERVYLTAGLTLTS